MDRDKLKFQIKSISVCLVVSLFAFQYSPLSDVAGIMSRPSLLLVPEVIFFAVQVCTWIKGELQENSTSAMEVSILALDLTISLL